MVNKVMILGNITRDIDVRFTPQGTAVADIGIALNNKVKKDDQWVDEVTFVDVTIWGNQAENAGKYLAKGRQVHIEGRLKMDAWDDKDTGKKRSKLKVIGDKVTFIGSKGDSPQMAAPKLNPTANSLGEDDDIPF